MVDATSTQSSSPLAQTFETDFSPLYRAQRMALATVKSTWFPCYNSEYVLSQQGIKGKFIWVYSRIYDDCALVGKALRKSIAMVSIVAQPILAGGKFLFGWAVNLVYPINHVSGCHHFVWVPRRIEKFLGDKIFFPLNTFDYWEKSQSSRQREKVQKVFSQLLSANQQLLNPRNEEVAFNYRVKVLRSTSINAFAVPGGGVAIFSQLVKTLENTIQRQKIKEVNINFADGSKATVDVSGVNLDDTLAAVLGHEMTHVASRHSMAALTTSCIATALSAIGRFALVTFLKNKDKRYLELKAKATLNPAERGLLRNKEAFYATINNIFKWMEDKILRLSMLLISRSHEYEADVTGVYCAQKANFNPLGALLLQEIFERMPGPASDFFHKHFEILFTHPYGENRKRAIFAAINEFDPRALQGRTTWKLTKSCYDLDRSSMAIRYATQASSAAA